METEGNCCFALSRDMRGVAYLDIRAGKINVLGVSEMESLIRAITEIKEDDIIRCLVVTGGNDRAWIGGANIKEMVKLDPATAREFISRVNDLCESVRTLSVPVIAAINGWCLGMGVEFAAACDIRVASTVSQFAMPEVKLGIPSVVHAAMLPRQIGAGRTRSWLLTGRAVDATVAHTWGLLDDVVRPENLDAAVEDIVSAIIECPAEAIRTQKALCNAWEELPLTEAIQMSIGPFGDAFLTDEPGMAMRAFLAKKLGN
ncbi:enoyl-CoA hydratase [Paraburkholderia panacisoli]|uniref:Enoyl-CoA hydratase n=2 Tax=Paraburkholderia panacisoli TaxID=2603818 RepID=A0A5B0GML6_9BURK|nr:enoyl-CoA hydratase [Paraburkholderia panacisoli]